MPASSHPPSRAHPASPDVGDTVARIARCQKLIAAAPPFNAWPPEACQALAQAASVARCRRGTLLTRRGQALQGLLLIAEGSADCTLSGSDGRQITVVNAMRGWVHGLIPLLEGTDLPHDLIASEDVTVVTIPFGAVHRVLEQSPALWASVAAELARRFRGLLTLTAQSGFDPAHVRLARTLSTLAKSHGQAKADGVHIQLRLSQELLGSMLGISRQSAITHLKTLVERGLISWHYGRATVLDLPGLQALVEREGIKV